MRIPQRSVLLLGVHLPVCEILENETTCTKESKVVNYTTYIPYRGHLIKQVHYHSKAKDKNKCSEKQKNSEMCNAYGAVCAGKGTGRAIARQAPGLGLGGQ